MNEVVKTDDFELSAEITAGKLTSNAKELAVKVKNELKNYTVEKYIGNPDLAKTDKAFLTHVKDTIASKRKEITAKWNEPLNAFMDEMKGLESAVTEAYNGLNSIVKEAETKEKDEKKKQIENYWKTLGITIVNLDRIFNPKWLNKTFKMENIMLEVEASVEKIQNELTTIKSMQSEDSEILQAFYLETLDLNATLAKGNELKANRAKIKAEEAKKAVEIVKNTFNGEVVEAPKTAEIQPKTEENQQIPSKNEQISAKNSEKSESLMTFTLVLHGTRQALLDLRRYIDSHNITYEKV